MVKFQLFKLWQTVIIRYAASQHKSNIFYPCIIQIISRQINIIDLSINLQYPFCHHWNHGCHLPTVCNFRKNSIVISVCSSYFIPAALLPCGELFSFCCHCLQWTPVAHCLCLYLLQRTIQQLKLHLQSSSSLILFTVIFSSFKSCLNN